VEKLYKIIPGNRVNVALSRNHAPFSYFCTIRLYFYVIQ